MPVFTNGIREEIETEEDLFEDLYSDVISDNYTIIGQDDGWFAVDTEDGLRILNLDPVGVVSDSLLKKLLDGEELTLADLADDVGPWMQSNVDTELDCDELDLWKSNLCSLILVLEMCLEIDEEAAREAILDAESKMEVLDELENEMYGG